MSLYGNILILLSMWQLLQTCHAMRTLTVMPPQRLIVEFAVEDSRALKLRERRKQRQMVRRDFSALAWIPLRLATCV